MVSTTDTTITVSFTEVDDGVTQPAGYDIRFGVAPVPWWEATSIPDGDCASPIMGTAIGALRTCIIHDLVPSTNYSIMIVAFRGTFNNGAVFGRIHPAIVATTTGSVSSVSITPASATVAVGQATQFTATAQDSAGNTITGRVFTWLSSDTALARVDSTGLATGVSAGSVTISASSGGRSDEAQVIVTATVSTVEVRPAATTVNVGETTQFGATLRDANGNVLSGRVVNWISGDSAVATISAAGMATAISAGTTTITATSEGTSGVAEVTVSAPPPPPPGDSGAPAFQDDFEGGVLTGPQNGYLWGPREGYPGQLPEVSSDRAHSGQYSLKFTYGPDAQTSGDDSWSEQRFRFGAYLPEVWFEYWWFVPANYFHRAIGNTPANNNNKQIVLWRDNYSSTTEWRTGFENYPNVTSGTANGSSALRPWTTTSTNGMSHEAVNYPPTPPDLNAWPNYITPTGPVVPGTWTQIRMHFKGATALGARNGQMQLWVNGELRMSKVNGDFIGSSGVNTLHNGYLMGWSNSGFDEVTNFYIDDFKIYSANPGW